MKVLNWNPTDGDALQGDVCLFRIPDSIQIDTSDEIVPEQAEKLHRGEFAAASSRLILASGEITGHHHAIWNPQPTMFRPDDAGSGLSPSDTAAMVAKATKAKAGTARLYRDLKALAALMRAGELTTDRLAIGFLVVEGKPVVLRHDEHDAIRIPPGRYYVGGQQEWDAATARRVAD